MKRCAAVVALVLGALLLPGPASARPIVVGSFTTRFPCCQPRVVNIRRAARLLDGRTLEPGGRFSMNRALGRRTRARGFVPAPMIAGGRLVDSVGGGISQVATTLYNAAFFAGLDLLAHTPHSFYISRYPPGREATISWGGPELVFANEWRAPLQIRLTAGSTALTVRFYSKPLGRRVEAWSGKPFAFVQPTTVVEHNPGLPYGSRRIVQQAGSAGFTVDYGRRVYRHKRLARNERWRVRYQPENRIVEVGTR
jgi:vancomycin resistance protein YoaR